MRTFALVASLTTALACAPAADPLAEISDENEKDAAPGSSDVEHGGADDGDELMDEVTAARDASARTPASERASAGGAQSSADAGVHELKMELDAGSEHTASVYNDAGQIMSPFEAGARSDPCGYPHYPPTQWVASAWTPFVTPGQVDEAALFAAVGSSMVGSWHGLATTPWTSPYEVDLRFGADGSYSGRCTNLSEQCCVAFYYGTDRDTPLKRYRLVDATLSGTVWGEIDIAFAYGPDNEGLPTWQGELSAIERDASGNGLRFQFRTSDGYGPVKFDLRRAQ